MRELIVWTGPVHSGKSTHALLRAARYRRLGHDVQLVRPRISVRPEIGDTMGMLKTKSGHRFPSIEIDNPTEIEEATEGCSVVWIDEAMLFGDKDHLVPDVVAWLRRRSIVLVSGLCMTSELRVFGSAMPQLMAMADDVKHCKADCDYCNSLSTATRSVCTVEKQGDVQVGASIYKAACTSCWVKQNRPDAVTALGEVAAS
jgi:thymidine kinase